jgi:hypothetical protein
MKLKGRWNCRHCLTAGWSRDGSIPPHDTPHGTSCLPSGQKSERKIKLVFTPTIEEPPIWK